MSSAAAWARWWWAGCARTPMPDGAPLDLSRRNSSRCTTSSPTRTGGDPPGPAHPRLAAARLAARIRRWTCTSRGCAASWARRPSSPGTCMAGSGSSYYPHLRHGRHEAADHPPGGRDQLDGADRVPGAAWGRCCAPRRPTRRRARPQCGPSGRPLVATLRRWPGQGGRRPGQRPAQAITVFLPGARPARGAGGVGRVRLAAKGAVRSPSRRGGSPGGCPGPAPGDDPGRSCPARNCGPGWAVSGWRWWVGLGPRQRGGRRPAGALARRPARGGRKPGPRWRGPRRCARRSTELAHEPSCRGPVAPAPTADRPADRGRPVAAGRWRVGQAQRRGARLAAHRERDHPPGPAAGGSPPQVVAGGPHSGNCSPQDQDRRLATKIAPGPVLVGVSRDDLAACTGTSCWRTCSRTRRKRRPSGCVSATGRRVWVVVSDGGPGFADRTRPAAAAPVPAPSRWTSPGASPRPRAGPSPSAGQPRAAARSRPASGRRGIRCGRAAGPVGRRACAAARAVKPPAGRCGLNPTGAAGHRTAERGPHQPGLGGLVRGLGGRGPWPPRAPEIRHLPDVEHGALRRTSMVCGHDRGRLPRRMSAPSSDPVGPGRPARQGHARPGRRRQPGPRGSRPGRRDAPPWQPRP